MVYCNDFSGLHNVVLVYNGVNNVLNVAQLGCVLVLNVAQLGCVLVLM